MELQVRDTSNLLSTGTTVSVSDEIFARDFNEALVHQVVTAYLAEGRAGTRAQKNRSAVSGGGAKPWRQKGTGRARAGTIRSPLWRGGGVTFAARPQNHSQKINKKMYRAAIRVIFSELVRQDRLLVVNELTATEPKTRIIAKRLKELGLDRRVLLVTEHVDNNLNLSVRNLPEVDICDVMRLNPVGLIRSDKVVITTGALERVGEWLL
jgi:large subunit ribosomal protein L4